MSAEDIDFPQCTHAFLKRANPARLQELADALIAPEVWSCGQEWLAAFMPFFTQKGGQTGWLPRSGPGSEAEETTADWLHEGKIKLGPEFFEPLPDELMAPFGGEKP